MPLTPEDVEKCDFATTRFRAGYDVDEVDKLLDRVVAELRRLNLENEELRDSQRREFPPTGPVPAPAPGPAADGPDVQDQIDAAARVLALAQQTSAHAVSEARQEAEGILRHARAEGEQISHDARALAATLEQRVRDQREQALGPLEEQRSALEQRIAELHRIEAEHRSRLHAYLQSPLPGPGAAPDVLDVTGPVTAPFPGPGPGSPSRNGGPPPDGEGQPARRRPRPPGPAAGGDHADSPGAGGRQGHGEAADPDSDPGPGRGPGQPGAEATWPARPAP